MNNSERPSTITQRNNSAVQQQKAETSDHPFTAALACTRKTLTLLFLGLGYSISSGVIAQEQMSNLKPAPWVSTDLKGVVCRGNLHGTYGPFDYTNPDHFQNNLPIVELYHFTPNVEMLMSSNTTMSPAGDIDYVLLTFPNHHRALYSMAKMHLEGHNDWTAEFPKPECYFQRALMYSPTDHVVPLLFGIYLHKIGRLDKALLYYDAAEKMDPEDSEVHYNKGLFFLDKKDYSNSLKSAKKAYALGYPVASLKNKLKKLGHWK